jgi:kynureninase
MQFENTLSFAQQLDEKDELKEFRKKFIIPTHNGQEQVYFLGNSLGLQPSTTKSAIQKILDQWATYGVEGFFMGQEPWLDYHDKLVKPLSKIVGALPHELSVMNQLTVNLHLMMVSFYRPDGRRKKIICEAKAFPSDQYMFETHMRHYGFDPADVIIEVGPRQGESLIRIEDILEAIKLHQDELALVLWGGVNYYTGQVFDMAKIAAATRAVGAKIGFDLAHAAGNIPLNLREWEVDFACWCSYKYLNSGPGAVGAVYINEKYHRDPSISRFAGWWGYQKQTRFLMEKGFVPAESAEGWQLSTPSLILYASHKASLEIFEEAGWDRIQRKRLLLTAYLWYLLDELNFTHKIEFITPREENARGCQVSMLMLDKGKEVFNGLMSKGIFTDWREPNVIRLAPVPLYNTFTEVRYFVDSLSDLLA